MTPWETKVWVEEASENHREQYRLAMWTAWHQEAFARRKRLPRLDALLKRLDKAPPKQSPKEIMAIVTEIHEGILKRGS